MESFIAEGLTIVIPTYNRRERLEHQFNSLLRQKEKFQDVRIIVADNHSDYDIEAALRPYKSQETFPMFEIVKRPFNMGMSLGLALPFSYCQTRWLWILSDDDEVVGDINQVKQDLGDFCDYSLLKYTNITGQPQTECELQGIYDFLKYYESPNHTAGDLLFLSNCIFNVEKLYPYIDNAFVWAGTLYGHIMPLLFGLTENPDGIKCKMRNYGLVKYLRPESPVSPSRQLRYAISFATIDDIVFPGEEKDEKLHRRICRIIQNGAGFFSLVSTIMQTTKRRESRNKFDRIYNAFFDYGIKNRCIKLLFVLSLLLHINLFYAIRHN